tara:strand:+ start:1 stop:693 length:693 start_codon:yes stop_codon:yes gene_type:complete
MSKSKKNTIDPENIIADYGADAVRLFILSDSPPEKDVQWSDQGMLASYKFVQKLWQLNIKIIKKIELNEKVLNNEDLKKFTNQIVNKVTQNLEKFHYNVIIANFHEMYNFFVKEVEKPINKKDLLDNYTKILILLNPFIPHFSNECLEKILSQEKIHWPVFDKNELIEENINYVIQINGKKKSMLTKKRDLNEEEILKVIKNHEQTKKLIDKKIIKKTIFIKNRLINFII